MFFSVFSVAYKSSTIVVHAEEGISMYCMYNPNSGEHFYTEDSNEKDHLVSVGWNYEGIGWVAPSSGDKVYRLYNPNGGEHHYTLDSGEKDMLVNAGWNDEGVGWYSDTSKTVPVYRQYNPNAFSCNHNYSTDGSEKAYLISIGWHDENVGWYALQSAKTASTYQKLKDHGYVFEDVAPGVTDPTLLQTGGVEGVMFKAVNKAQNAAIYTCNGNATEFYLKKPVAAGFAFVDTSKYGDYERTAKSAVVCLPEGYYDSVQKQGDTYTVLARTSTSIISDDPVEYIGFLQEIHGSGGVADRRDDSTKIAEAKQYYQTVSTELNRIGITEDELLDFAVNFKG